MVRSHLLFPVQATHGKSLLCDQLNIMQDKNSSTITNESQV